ncbi:hypothetical protein SAMN02927897_03672 [Kosakonia sacchari]|uniref:Uncharacterized protein n=1 Tax=Kosakonia sacchari TaxID=1158459 RepID=A0A1G4YZ43_9ENTR|nr:hypothetical protein SAMN02927897_03672 [Kosakonia sacchari]
MSPKHHPPRNLFNEKGANGSFFIFYIATQLFLFAKIHPRAITA